MATTESDANFASAQDYEAVETTADRMMPEVRASILRFQERVLPDLKVGPETTAIFLRKLKKLGQPGNISLSNSNKAAYDTSNEAIEMGLGAMTHFKNMVRAAAIAGGYSELSHDDDRLTQLGIDRAIWHELAHALDYSEREARGNQAQPYGLRGALFSHHRPLLREADVVMAREKFAEGLTITAMEREIKSTYPSVVSDVPLFSGLSMHAEAAESVYQILMRYEKGEFATDEELLEELQRITVDGKSFDRVQEYFCIAGYGDPNRPLVIERITTEMP